MADLSPKDLQRISNRLGLSPLRTTPNTTNATITSQTEPKSKEKINYSLLSTYGLECKPGKRNNLQLGFLQEETRLLMLNSRLSQDHSPETKGTSITVGEENLPKKKKTRYGLTPKHTHEKVVDAAADVDQAINKIKKNQQKRVTDRIRVMAQSQSVDTICKQFLSNLSHKTTRELWKRLLRGYQILSVQGRGTYGIVFKGRSMLTQKEVAIKYVMMEHGDMHALKTVIGEIQVMRKLAHKKGNIYTTEIIDLLVPEVVDGDSIESIFIVMDYCPYDLNFVLHHSHDMDEHHVATLLYNMLSALEFLHSNNLMHRDIKPSNWLVRDNCSILLCDFGSTRPTAPQLQSKQNPTLQSTLMPVILPDDMVNKNQSRFIQVKKSEKRQDFEQKMLKASADQQSNLFDEATDVTGLLNDQSMISSVFRRALTHRRSEIAKNQQQDRMLNFNKKRRLSAHVCSRNYRAPEVILLEKDYGQGMDMWSLGCILAQLLEQIVAHNSSQRNADDSSNADNSKQFKPFFPGDTCYPLSPLKNVTLGHIDFNDQLRHILDFVNKPGVLDLAFISEPSAIQYCKNIGSLTRQDERQKLGIEACQFRAKFQSIQNQGLVDILEGLLQFNPGFRLTAKEALKHKMFDSMRVGKRQEVKNDPIDMPVYADGLYDYENSQWEGLDYKHMQQMLLDEVAAFKVPACSVNLMDTANLKPPTYKTTYVSYKSQKPNRVITSSLPKANSFKHKKHSSSMARR